MKKFLLFSCFIGLFCLAGCSGKKAHMPTEDEILQAVSESVPIEYELVDISHEENLITCYFKCVDRPLEFKAQGYVTNNIGAVPMPQFMWGYKKVIVVQYWHEIYDYYYADIIKMFEETEIFKRGVNASGYKNIHVVLKNDEDLELFVDLVMQGEALIEQELEYVSEADLIKHPIVEYTIWVPFVQVYASGKTEDNQCICCDIKSDSTLERDTLLEFVKNSIEEKNNEIAGNNNVVMYNK